ncbi:hypothetical protein Tcan_07475 [Toxocara canis]|uniref:Secreted protein n=1 Tax=Toxocara canis TaxID=6265 RepID=A0A0B2VUI4_TOXCA|nr:hypothetical protein Tcan_07475 [Toxocara canis]
MNVLLLVPLATSTVYATCPLLWNSKQNLGYEHGFQVINANSNAYRRCLYITDNCLYGTYAYILFNIYILYKRTAN